MIFVEKHTPEGNFKFAITSANHVSIQGNVILRGKDYKVHIHLHLQPDGSWANHFVDHEGKTSKIANWVRRNQVDVAPPTVEEKVVKLTNEAWASFVTSSEAPAELAKAEADEASMDVSVVRQKRDAAAKELEEFEVHLRTAMERFNTAFANHLLTEEDRKDFLSQAGLGPESDVSGSAG